MSAEGFAADWDWLESLGPAVAVLHMLPNHFVTVLKARERDATVFDPAIGAVLLVDRAKLEGTWSGRAIRIGYAGPFDPKLSQTSSEM